MAPRLNRDIELVELSDDARGIADDSSTEHVDVDHDDDVDSDTLDGLDEEDDDGEDGF